MKHRIAYFMWDRTDAGVIKRVQSLQTLGYDVVGLSFFRERYNTESVPFWVNIDLGLVRDKHYVSRLPKLARGIVLALKNRALLSRSDLFMARGLELLVLAIFVKFLLRLRVRIAYEVYDIHHKMISNSHVGTLFRFIERSALSHIDLLVVTSPGYLHNYFVPVQNFRGRHAVVENKLPANVSREAISEPTPSSMDQQRIVIGWSGALRCMESLAILRKLALALPDKVDVYIWGWPAEMPLEEFESVVADTPNMYYFGPYRSPDDLGRIYSCVDINWVIDLQFRGGNSDWLLPFRIYEGGFYNVPALGAAGLAAGDKIEQLGLGWTIQEPYLEDLIGLLGTLSRSTLAEKKDELRRLPRELFAGDGELAGVLQSLLDGGQQNLLQIPSSMSPEGGNS